jgi:hypothetical protein
MKLVYGESEHKLTWKDASFASGLTLTVGGLAASFGWGILLASAGVALMVAPFLRMETPA